MDSVVQFGVGDQTRAQMVATYVSKVAGLLQDKENIDADIKAVCESAKDAGFKPGQIKRAAMFALARKKKDKYFGDHDTLLEYMHSAGIDTEQESDEDL